MSFDTFDTSKIEAFAQLGQNYGAGGEFTRNINVTAGPGVAEFASQTVAAYCVGA